MINWLGAAYPWVKAAHIIFMVFWMAGLFILPRYLIHHQEGGLGTPEAARWVEREAKLRTMILTPSIIVVWALGLALGAHIGLFNGAPGLGWLHLKLLLVLVLSGYHGWAVGYARKLAAGRATLPARTLRMVNEAPAVLLALIVILAVVKPF
jgi:putative membrane protein